jgi:hemoglobin-like flavoprotein
MKRNNETLIAHTKNIQFNHVQEIKTIGNTTHPSDGKQRHILAGL